ncbi:hypothetical protein CCAX7_19370 [Capsulimonas corticalis]|uniref:Uncharacterized protein n=1 Tax=Capsulimonas corticalis TaxID=2219043 RepID=A0A402D590_9BACT|nr:energy transducer TonB [Capsulimonas corticalis]BDI29886.1 hypothetical protein CCAX7_19370 [Capsulimonas corticalis]
MAPSTLPPPTQNSSAHGGLAEDRPSRRLAWAVTASLAANALLWWQAARILPHTTPSPTVIEVTRVVPPKPEHRRPEPKPRVVPPKPKPIVPPPPLPRAVHTPPRVTARPIPQPLRPVPRHAPPAGAHSHVLTARPDHAAPAPQDHTALAGGGANLGAPLGHQNAGGAHTEAPPQPAPVAPPAPAPEPPRPAPQAPVEAAKPEPPKPAPPPAPAGPTQDAEPSNQEKPEIPDELKQDTFKSFVRVKVEIEADGSFTPTLRTSSGNAEIDRRVLAALQRWRWKPALQNGAPVHSTQLFRFEFEVE